MANKRHRYRGDCIFCYGRKVRTSVLFFLTIIFVPNSYTNVSPSKTWNSYYLHRYTVSYNCKKTWNSTSFRWYLISNWRAIARVLYSFRIHPVAFPEGRCKKWRWRKYWGVRRNEIKFLFASVFSKKQNFGWIMQETLPYKWDKKLVPL